MCESPSWEIFILAMEEGAQDKAWSRQGCSNLVKYFVIIGHSILEYYLCKKNFLKRVKDRVAKIWLCQIIMARNGQYWLGNWQYVWDI